MTIRNIISVLAMALVAAASLAYMGSVGLSVTDNVGVRTAHLQVANSNGLVPGSRVLYRGVAIGQVTDVVSNLKGVDVTWNYKDTYLIPANSSFRVDNLSALGEAYLGISPSDSSKTLPEGAVLTAKSVTIPTTFAELSQQLVRVLEQIHSDDVDTIVSEVNTGLVGDQQVLTNLNKAGSLLETTILATRAPFTTLLDRFQPLLDRGADISGSLAMAGQPVRELGSQIKLFLDWCTRFVRADNLPTELTDGAGPFLKNLQAFLDKAAPDIKVLGDAALPAIEPATAKLKTVDLSQLMRTALAVAGTGDGVDLSVGVPQPK